MNMTACGYCNELICVCPDDQPSTDLGYVRIARPGTPGFCAICGIELRATDGAACRDCRGER